MASIYLIRHSQAGFYKLNYDQLSQLGHQQAEHIGKALAARGIEAHRVIHGRMQRHVETMQGAQKHWHSYGKCIEEPNFNEFDSDEIIAKAFPKFSNKAALGAWLASKSNKRRAFQELFVKAIERWVSGDFDEEYQESWLTFNTRVKQGLADLIAQSEGKDVVVFTSGGPISVMAQHCLELNTEKTFELNWTLINGGISQLLYSSSNPERISLASFNDQQHLSMFGSKFITYR